MFVYTRVHHNCNITGNFFVSSSSADEENTWEEARLTREAGIDILTIGIGGSIRERELRAMASFPNVLGENVLLARTFNLLDDYVNDVIMAACNSESDTIKIETQGSCHNYMVLKLWFRSVALHILAFLQTLMIA